MRLAILLLLLATLLAAPAAATPTTYGFAGTCSDCSGTATAELTLQNYTPGQAVTAANFISLHYDGSNLFSAFTITNPIYIAGEFDPPLPGSDSFYASDYTHFFQSSVSGLWSVGNASFIFADMGTAGTYTIVPEPFSIALLLTALASIAATRPRPARTRR